MLFNCLSTQSTYTKFLARYFDIKVGSGTKAVKGSRAVVDATKICVYEIYHDISHNGRIIGISICTAVCKSYILHLPKKIDDTECNNQRNRGMVTHVS
jgi:uncharacterized protein YuzE